MIPVRLSGKSYTELLHYHPEPLWKIRIDAERHFDTDAYLHVESQLLPEFQTMHKKVLLEEPDNVVWQETYHTAKGDLQRLVQVTHPNGLSVLEPLVKTPDDLERALLLYGQPEQYDFAAYLEAYNYLGEDGCLAPYLKTPADELSDLFGGPQNFIMAHYDAPEKLHEFMLAYTDFTVRLLQEYLRRNLPLDVIQLGGATLSHSVTSPEFFDYYAAHYLRAVLALEKQHPEQLLIQLHTCGKARQVLDQAAALGLRAFEPIEEPPMGNVDLQEIKNAYGRTVALKGNINSISTMLQGTPEQVRRETMEKLKIGMPGGGFFLSVGDQTPYFTPYENIQMLVKTVHEFGRYATGGLP
jgi:uroporphyrinogen decarboxylase